MSWWLGRVEAEPRKYHVFYKTPDGGIMEEIVDNVDSYQMEAGRMCLATGYPMGEQPGGIFGATFYKGRYPVFSVASSYLVVRLIEEPK